MELAEKRTAGSLVLVSGPMVAATGLAGVAMGEIVRVGKLGLMGEIIRIDGETVYAQVFEDTQGINLGETMEATGSPLTVELGPGLLGGTFDGIQRSLVGLRDVSGPFIARGLTASALDRERLWRYAPTVDAGTEIEVGDILGTVQETGSIEHRVMTPPGTRGIVKWVAAAGEYTVTDVIAVLSDGSELTMMHRWPVRTPRPMSSRLDAKRPFLTGQRVLDCLFPIALGGSAIVPGGFGTGKTVVEQTLAKHSNAQVIVYVGCGERGNEMADVLSEFPDLKDPSTGRALMDRTILVVNTSNMPVAARDASVYTGITLAEYYRDMGYDVAVMADSTSRWAEALREMSSRLEEMPGEEGYPTYLATRVSEFYERAGRVVCAGTRNDDQPRTGSVTLVGAVSPPGGDFSEPVTQTSQRVAGALWALDASLAYRRHYPAINWNRSYSLYFTELDSWFDKHAPTGWCDRRREMAALLQKEAELQEVVQLVGPDALQDKERLLLEMGKLVREVFLQQNAFSEADANSSPEKTGGLLDVLMLFRTRSAAALDSGVRLDHVLELSAREELAQLREVDNDRFEEEKRRVIELMQKEFDAVAQ